MDDVNYYSIDRLVEFGMGMAVAQQMVKSMNETLQQMHVPGTFTMPRSQPTTLFYAVVGGKQMGPLSEHEVAGLIQEKKIVNETYMWKPGMLAWELAERLPEIVRLAALTPPPHPTKDAAQ